PRDAVHQGEHQLYLADRYRDLKDMVPAYLAAQKAERFFSAALEGTPAASVGLKEIVGWGDAENRTALDLHARAERGLAAAEELRGRLEPLAAPRLARSETPPRPTDLIIAEGPALTTREVIDLRNRQPIGYVYLDAEGGRARLLHHHVYSHLPHRSYEEPLLKAALQWAWANGRDRRVEVAHVTDGRVWIALKEWLGSLEVIASDRYMANASRGLDPWTGALTPADGEAYEDLVSFSNRDGPGQIRMARAIDVRGRPGPNVGGESVARILDGLVSTLEAADWFSLYHRQIQLLVATGVLHRDARLFYPLTGADLLPGAYVRQLWTSDFRLELPLVLNNYQRARAASRSYTQESGTPLWPAVLSRESIEHTRADVLSTTVLDDWIALMRPGDVVFLRFPFYFLLEWNRREGGRLEAWFENFIRKIPAGVPVVLIEGGFRTSTWMERAHRIFARNGFGLSMENRLLPAERSVLGRANAVLEKTGPLEMFVGLHLNLALGGALWVYEKLPQPLAAVPGWVRGRSTPGNLLGLFAVWLGTSLRAAYVQRRDATAEVLGERDHGRAIAEAGGGLVLLLIAGNW
ncbi:MAG TPA: hypothetical protein PKX64_09105, partial [Elusimicrobiota bacterium]|nr:hypothetical protein [Elusimicrobiota bacterium]